MRDDDGVAPAPGLSRGALLLFAVAGGLSVANIYAAQPLLDAMAADFGIGAAAIGGVVTVTQLGYALGLILIVPLGDLVDRRRLITGQAVLTAIALAVVGTATSAPILLAGMVAVGLLAVVIQVLVAFAATLAAPAERGRAVGTVTSGVVTGLLLARFGAGTLADLGGWRAVNLTAAGLALGMAALLYRVLPRHAAPAEPTSYGALLRSVPRLFVEEPVLRIRAVLALLTFAAVSTFWTAMVLPLSAPPFALSHTAIGLFGLVGVAGAWAAGGAGRRADRGLGERTTGIALALMLAAWVPLALLQVSVWALIPGVILLDLGIQAVHVTSQGMIFALRPEARSRLVAGYMVFYAIGSAIGSIAATTAYAAAGWPGVCALGALFSAGALAFWAATRRVGVTGLRTAARASPARPRGLP